MSNEIIEPYFSETARQGWGPDVIEAMDEREQLYRQTLEQYGVTDIIYLPAEVQEWLNGQLKLDLTKVLRGEDE